MYQPKVIRNTDEWANYCDPLAFSSDDCETPSSFPVVVFVQPLISSHPIKISYLSVDEIGRLYMSALLPHNTESMDIVEYKDDEHPTLKIKSVDGIGYWDLDRYGALKLD